MYEFKSKHDNNCFLKRVHIYNILYNCTKSFSNILPIAINIDILIQTHQCLCEAFQLARS